MNSLALALAFYNAGQDVSHGCALVNPTQTLAGTGGPINPPNLSTFKAFWRADQGITLGTGVLSLADLSGNGPAQGQATGSAQPTVNATDSNFGNQQTLSMASASAQFLQSASGIALAMPYTVVFVGSCIGNFESMWGDAATGTGPSLYQASVATLFSGGGVGAAISATSPCVIACVISSSTGKIYVNSSASASGSGTIVGAALAGEFYLGKTQAGLGVGTLNGKFAEAGIYPGDMSASSALANYFAYAGDRYNHAWS